MLMFTDGQAGKAKEAIATYSSIFPNSQTEMIMQYEKGDGDNEEYIKHARFTLDGMGFMAMDSSFEHKLNFNEAVSFIVTCDTQEEIDYYWEKLSAVPESEQCGWLKNKYDVSWQIVPSIMGKLLTSGDKEKTARVTQAFLKMKKFNIQELKRAFKN